MFVIVGFFFLFLLVFIWVLRTELMWNVEVVGIGDGEDEVRVGFIISTRLKAERGCNCNSVEGNG